MQIDKEAGVIHDVLVLGRRTKNRRKYTTQAMEDAVRRRMYERLPVYIGPHKKSRFAKRSPNDHAGELRNVRLAKDGVRGDLHYNRASKGGRLVLEIAERFPDSFGLSHHANIAGYENEDGEKIITSIVDVTVADLVKDPATTKNVFESVEDSPRRRRLQRRKLLKRMERQVEEATEAVALEAIRLGVPLWRKAPAITDEEVAEAVAEARASRRPRRPLTQRQVLDAYTGVVNLTDAEIRQAYSGRLDPDQVRRAYTGELDPALLVDLYSE